MQEPGNDKSNLKIIKILQNTIDNRVLLIVPFLLLTHACLLLIVGMRNSPNSDEVAHLAAGVYNWQVCRFDLYRVNPPLVRIIAAIPVVYHQPQTDWDFYLTERNKAGARPEWSIGQNFLRINIHKTASFFSWARWACIPFSLLGGFFCWRWADELYGKPASVLALILWCFSPNVITWSATICPDSPAAALGVTGGYYFWKWLKDSAWSNALLAGTLFGLILLTKMTWLILFAVWPLLWLIWIWQDRSGLTRSLLRNQFLQLMCILVIGLYVLNLGYGFEGTLSKISHFTFVSRTLAGTDSIADGGEGGNRFSENWLGNLPLPFPAGYVQGVDLQKVDFEKGLPSYLLGKWKNHGWWYYYLVCILVKVPLGTWLLAVLTVEGRLSSYSASKNPRLQQRATQSTSQKIKADWRDEMVLLLPAILLFLFVSSQSGFSRHFRYVLPAFPFMFIWISSVASLAQKKTKTFGVFLVGGVTWMLVSSMWVFPHSMSYFNEFTSGPGNGYKYLLGSNFDWGQDIYYLKKWCKSHPEAIPLHTIFRDSFSVDLLKIGQKNEFPKLKVQSLSANNVEKFELTPGWYAISIHRIHDSDREYYYFQQFTPVARVGYSIKIYHITLDDLNRVRFKQSVHPVQKTR